MTRFSPILSLVVVTGCAAHQVPPPVVTAPEAHVSVVDGVIESGATVGIEWYGVKADPTVTLHDDGEGLIDVVLLLPMDVRGIDASASLTIHADTDAGTVEVQACVDAPLLTDGPMCKQSPGAEAGVDIVLPEIDPAPEPAPEPEGASTPESVP